MEHHLLLFVTYIGMQIVVASLGVNIFMMAWTITHYATQLTVDKINVVDIFFEGVVV